MAWCHGAPGIGLSRRRAAEILAQVNGDSDAGVAAATACRDEAAAAARATARSLRDPAAATTSHCRCHGALGNCELFLRDHQGEPGNENGDTRIPEAVARRGIELFEQRDLPWPCGVNGGGETPGLLLGTAGIGYAMLRLYDPAVPSVLLVCP
jgi:lantibiotic modifying enzyme